jgi:EmrB/QacA subfamily drug resistance transporter
VTSSSSPPVAAAESSTEIAPARSRWIPILVASAFFMENLDSTVITTSIPAMARSFAVEPAQLSIGISSYLLALAVLIPASGWMVDRFGARRVFSSAILIFTGASILCGLSSTLWAFTAARILQGIGGAMMVPVGRLVVLRHTQKKDLLRAIATISWPGLAAPILGPPVGGFITTTWSWHWIFFLNVPLGIVALVTSLFLIRSNASQRRPFDLYGFVLTAVGCSLVMLGVELASHAPFDSQIVGGALLIGTLSLVLAVRHLRRATHPLIDLSSIRIPTFAVVLVGGSLFRIAISSAPFLLPLMFQVAFGFSPVTSGMLMLALFAGNLGVKPTTSWFMRRYGFKRVLITNGVFVIVGFAACAFLTRDTPLWLIAVVLFFGGVCRSMQFTVLNTIGFADIGPARMSGATTLFSMFQQINGGLGIALGALALRVAGWFDGSESSPATFRCALGAMAALAALAIIDVIRLKSDAGAAVSGHVPTRRSRPA